MNGRALVLGGGSHAHDFAATTAELAAALTARQLTCTVVEHPDEAWAALAATSFDLFAVNALRFTMTDARYDSLRDVWRYATPPDADAALTHHLAAGGAVLAMHTSCICFDDWPGWSAALGRAWSWNPNRPSWHPELGPITVTVTAADGNTPEAFELIDERYTDLVDLLGNEWNDDRVATSDRVGTSDRADPSDLGRYDKGYETVATCDGRSIAWRRHHGGGRVAVDTLGHGVATYRHPSHKALLADLLDWLLNPTDAAPQTRPPDIRPPDNQHAGNQHAGNQYADNAEGTS